MTLIKVKRSITQKLFKTSEAEIREKLSGEELEEGLKLLPTDEEREWMKIFTSNAPELARLQRKMSVCLDADIDELEENKISFTYGNDKYEISGPFNSFRVLKSLEDSKSDALLEMAKQGCIKKLGTAIYTLDKEPMDVLNLILKITNKFFFQSFL